MESGSGLVRSASLPSFSLALGARSPPVSEGTGIRLIASFHDFPRVRGGLEGGSVEVCAVASSALLLPSLRYPIVTRLGGDKNKVDC